jgi:DNA-binding transcriptional LysR family regulator
MTELRLLKHFIAAAESKNLSVAGERVHLSQPALTRSIQHLEQVVGAPLFRRATGGLLLTPAGERYLKFAKMILEECAHAKEVVGAVRAGTAGNVSIGMGALFSHSIMRAVTLRCHKEMPNVALRAVEATVDVLFEAVRHGEVDFAVTSLSRGSVPDSLVWEPLSEMQDVLVASSDHPLAGVRTPAPHAITGARWVVLDRIFAHESFAEYFVLRRCSVPRALRTNSMILVRGLLLRHGFLAFLPQDVVADDVNVGRLRVLDARPAPQARITGLLTAGDRALSQACVAVMNNVRKVCAERQVQAAGTVEKSRKRKN